MISHTRDRTCPRCPGGRGTPGRCDLARYSARWIAFLLVPRHLEAVKAAFLDGGPAARHEVARLHREFVSLPARHLCTCVCPRQEGGWAACAECVRLHKASVRQDGAVEIGRTSRLEPPMPSAEMLDLARAVAAGHKTASAIARYLNGPEWGDWTLPTL